MVVEKETTMAKSTLLGGFRVWVPNEQGKPLHKGRASFFVAGTNTPAVVYKDQDCNIPWGTQVAVDNQGYIGDSENGVWLKTDFLYKVVVEQKICSDPEEWKPMWKIDGVGSIDDDDGGYGVSSISIVESYPYLKALRPGQFDYVFVAGFYNPGDTGEPMCFRWVADKVVEDDNGAYVKPSVGSSGAWEQMFNSGEIDVRKFGAIPDVDQYVDSNILDAMNYAVEPRFISVDGSKHEPKTIVFSKSGRYKLAGSVDFTDFKMIAAYGSKRAGVVIGEGVVFDAPSKVVTFGRGHRIDSSTNIVSEGTTLSIEAKSMEFVRPQWFGNENTDRSYAKAISSGNNVFVYGDMYPNYFFSYAADVNFKGKFSLNERTYFEDIVDSFSIKRNDKAFFSYTRGKFDFSGTSDFDGDVRCKGIEASSISVDGDAGFKNANITGSLAAITIGSVEISSFNYSLAVICAGGVYDNNSLEYADVDLKLKQGNLKVLDVDNYDTLYSLQDLFPNASHGDVVFLLLPKFVSGKNVKVKYSSSASSSSYFKLTTGRCHPFFVFEDKSLDTGSEYKTFYPMYDK